MKQKRRPRIGLVPMALPGFYLGEELCGEKFDEMLGLLKQYEQDMELIPASAAVLSQEDAKEAGRKFAQQDVDCIVAVVTTFVADYFVTELLSACEKPVFLWIVDRELHCIPLVCGPLVTASLYNLGYDYCISADDIKDSYTLEKLKTFAAASMMKNLLGNMQVGYTGGKPAVMFSMAADEYVLARKLGVSIRNFPIEEFYEFAGKADRKKAEELWRKIKSEVGEARVQDQDGIDSAVNYLAIKELVAQYRLDAISINCFPLLKARVCLPVSLLNDELIGAGCEGDLHATILMYLMEQLSGRAAFNGDFLKLYPGKNEIMFSHCGAGGLTLAGDVKKVCLCASAETNDGIGVIYNTEMNGIVTLVNLMTEPGGLRMAAMTGTRKTEDSGYCGNPLRLGFSTDVRNVLQNVADCGAGHHWVGIEGDYLESFRLLAAFLKLPFTITGEA